MIEQKRAGETKVTSVSVSERFRAFIDDYNLSPSDCFRKGVAVTLCDLGVGMYQSEKNEERSKYVKEFMEKLDHDEKLAELYNKIELFEKLQKQFVEIKKLIGEIENDGKI